MIPGNKNGIPSSEHKQKGYGRSKRRFLGQMWPKVLCLGGCEKYAFASCAPRLLKRRPIAGTGKGSRQAYLTVIPSTKISIHQECYTR